MDFFKSRSENYSLYTTGLFLIVSNLNLATSVLILLNYRSETSWALYLIESTFGSKWLALWTFVFLYMQVCLILPQLFPMTMKSFSMQEFESLEVVNIKEGSPMIMLKQPDGKVAEKRKSGENKTYSHFVKLLNSLPTNFHQTDEAEMPSIIKALEKAIED